MSATLDAIRRHSSTAIGIARSFYRKLPKHVPLGDIEQAALIGLWRWKTKHPDETAEGWLHGLRVRIRGAIVDELRRQDWRPRAYKGERIAAKLLAWDQIDPEWEQHMAAPGEDPEQACARRQRETLVNEARRGLTNPRHAKVIDLAFYREQRQPDIGKRFGVSAARVSQLQSAALKKMEPRLRAHLKGEIEMVTTLPEDGMDLRAELGRYQNWMVQQALIRANGNKARAAKLLGLERTTLIEMMKRSGVLRPLVKCGAKPAEGV